MKELQTVVADIVSRITYIMPDWRKSSLK